MSVCEVHVELTDLELGIKEIVNVRKANWTVNGLSMALVLVLCWLAVASIPASILITSEPRSST